MTKLETAMHVALLSLAIIAGALLLEQRFGQPRTTTRADLEQSLRDTKLGVPSVGWESNRWTFALQISSTCPYCVANEPFYKKLITMSNAMGTSAKKTGVIVLTADDSEALRTHLYSAGIIVDKVIHVNEGATGTAATPVIFFVNPDGIVQRAFVGQLDEVQQAQVLKLLQL